MKGRTTKPLTKPNQGSSLEAFLIDAERHEQLGDLHRAFACLLKGARFGDSSCQLNVGNFYSDGKAVKKNLKLAARWYKQAYRNGNSSGALNLAIDLRDQWHMRAAVIWFKKAIQLKDGDAYVELAKIYKSRRGGKKPAMDLLKEVAALGPSCASENCKEEAEDLLKLLRRE